MASMFENYNNLSSQYIPTNIPKAPIPPQCPPKPLCPPEPNKPYEDYNAKGELVGYWWSYGDTINLDFELDGYVTIDGSDNYISVKEFIKDKEINIALYNFRYEEIINMLFDGKEYQDKDTVNVIFPIDKELSKSLVPGTYYCSLTIIGKEVSATIFYEDSCTLTVR